MKILFVGESWMGSSARSLKESLRDISNHSLIDIDEINEDLYLPKHRTRWLRAVHRILLPAYRNELANAIKKKCRDARSQVLMVYKGYTVNANLIRAIKAMGIYTINVFPDYSPHAYGASLQRAMAEYDLVISTKPFHPSLWQSLYGYRNNCVFVPHGYDSSVHLLSTSPDNFQYDLGLVATWRPEYHELMQHVAGLMNGQRIRVAVAGYGWIQRSSAFPNDWIFPGEILGSEYARWARRSKILIAPVNRHVVINGQRQPGDEDSTRTYELAAANCFFIHRRTEYVKTLYDETTEVPFFDDAEELVKLVQYFLPKDELRAMMAAAAHARAVPAYSIDSRAEQIATLVHTFAGLKDRTSS